VRCKQSRSFPLFQESRLALVVASFYFAPSWLWLRLRLRSHRASRDTWNLPVSLTPNLCNRSVTFRSISLWSRSIDLQPPSSLRVAAFHFTTLRRLQTSETGCFPHARQESWICFGNGSRVEEFLFGTLRACAFANPATLAVAPNLCLTSERKRYAMNLSAFPLPPKPRFFASRFRQKSESRAPRTLLKANRECGLCSVQCVAFTTGKRYDAHTCASGRLPCFPGSDTRAVICNAASMPVSAPQNLRH
jgi:hypothetical protein